MVVVVDEAPVFAVVPGVVLEGELVVVVPELFEPPGVVVDPDEPVVEPEPPELEVDPELLLGPGLLLDPEVDPEVLGVVDVVEPGPLDPDPLDPEVEVELEPVPVDELELGLELPVPCFGAVLCPCCGGRVGVGAEPFGCAGCNVCRSDGNELVNGVPELARWTGVVRADARRGPCPPARRGSVVSGLVPAGAARPAPAAFPVARTDPPAAARESMPTAATALWCVAALPASPGVPGSEPRPAPTPPPMAPIARSVARPISGAPSAPDALAAGPR